MHERKIPTIVGVLLVGVAVFVFRFAFDRVSPLLTKASETAAPNHVAITNVTDSAFTVTWTSTTPTTGFLRVSGDVFYDDRLSAGESSPNTPAASKDTTHTISVRNLKPDTVYPFEIISNGRVYRSPELTKEIRTAPQIPGLGTSMEPAYGMVTSVSGDPLEGALVYLILEGGQELSTMTKQGGTWVIPLNRVRTSNLSTYLPLSDRINETITIRTNQGEAFATSDTLNDNPVPSMTIGKTYDFRKIQAEKDKSSDLAQNPTSVLGTTTQIPSGEIAITKPQDGANLTSNLPLIQGTGIPGRQVLITIGIEHPMSDTFIVGDDGIWRYTPPKPLSPGKQSVTITTTDGNNRSVAITHLFDVLKSGTQVLGEATPSAILTPIETPTPTATLAGEPIPETGTSLPLLSMLILGIGLIGSGLVTYARRYT